jgi:hypothetical protein
MRYVFAILLVLAVASGSGCDGDGDTPSQDAGNGGNGNGGNGGSSTVLLALGSGGTYSALPPKALFMVTEPGTLKATITWSGDGVHTLGVAFSHEGGASIYAGSGSSSPVTATQTVTPAHVAGGPNWALIFWDMTAADATVNYKVEFTPD